jgi:hypothetical protein
MAELTSKPSPYGKLGTKAGFNSCKLESAQDSTGASPLCPLIYVRYKDHVIYKNMLQLSPDVIERETVGWLTHENQDVLHIENDRPIELKGKGNGIIIVRSCIIEVLPLQKNLNWHLNRKQAIEVGEYAFRMSERKTHGAKDSRRNSEC